MFISKMVITIGLYTDDYSYAALVKGETLPIAHGVDGASLADNLCDALRIRFKHESVSGETNHQQQAA